MLELNNLSLPSSAWSTDERIFIFFVFWIVVGKLYCRRFIFLSPREEEIRSSGCENTPIGWADFERLICNKIEKRVSVRKKNSQKTRNNNHRRVENFEGSKASLALGDLGETKTQFFSESTLHLHRQVRDTHEAFVCH